MLSGLIQAILDEVSSAFVLMVVLFVGILLISAMVNALGDPYGIVESFKTAIMLILVIPPGLGILGYVIYKVATSR